MSRHSITLARDEEGRTSPNRLGTDALTALSSIPGVDDVQVVEESEKQVELLYAWSGSEKFWETNEYLSKFGLRRVK